MSRKRSKFMKSVMREIRREAAPLIEDALRNGVTQLSRQLIDSSGQARQLSDMNPAKLVGALKETALNVGQELLTNGLNRVTGTIEAKEEA